VVKVGSGVLTDRGALRRRIFAEIARQVSELCDAGREVLVSSGSIAMGSRTLGWSHPALDPREAGRGGGRADQALGLYHGASRATAGRSPRCW
jgi:hypothetical protein